MYERYRLEKDQKEIPKRLVKQFSMLHGASSLANLVSVPVHR